VCVFCIDMADDKVGDVVKVSCDVATDVVHVNSDNSTDADRAKYLQVIYSYVLC
jgi:hypothetical protein